MPAEITLDPGTVHYLADMIDCGAPSCGCLQKAWAMKLRKLTPAPEEPYEEE